MPVSRVLLDKVLPAPGEGPSEKTRESGHFTVDLYTTTESGARYTARFAAQGDPGYKATAVMLAESALSLASGGGLETAARPVHFSEQFERSDPCQQFGIEKSRWCLRLRKHFYRPLFGSGT